MIGHQNIQPPKALHRFRYQSLGCFRARKITGDGGAIFSSEFLDQLFGRSLRLFIVEQHTRPRGYKQADSRRANAT